MADQQHADIRLYLVVRESLRVILDRFVLLRVMLAVSWRRRDAKFIEPIR